MEEQKAKMEYVLTCPTDTAPEGLELYRSRGGYEALARAVQLPPSQVIDWVVESGLRGRGGAAFPTGKKWQRVVQGEGPRYIVANGAEGEKGSIKDQFIMERYPHRVLEGLILGAYAIGAEKAYLFVNGNFEAAVANLQQAIEEAKAAGFWGDNVLGSGFSVKVILHAAKKTGYVAGEETAVLEAIEGRHPRPRMKPPYPAVAGLFGRPTAVNNVETLAQVPAIVRRGADGPAWFRSLGTPESPGTALFSLTGDINRPGVYELPFGTPLRYLIEECGGGLIEGAELQAVLPGGYASGFLAPQHLDIPLSYEAMKEAGTMMGASAVIVVSNKTPLIHVIKDVTNFFATESCKQCVLCFAGNRRLNAAVTKVYEGTPATQMDIDHILETNRSMHGRGACGHINGAPDHLAQVLKLFPEALTCGAGTAVGSNAAGKADTMTGK